MLRAAELAGVFFEQEKVARFGLKMGATRTDKSCGWV